jgi:hypothetical protein
MISAASSSSPGAGLQTPAKPAPTAAEQKRAEAAKAKLQDFQSALTTLKSLHESSKSTAAGLAAQKLEALKQRLKMLMMFGGDPKAIAKEAAQIAKEIGQAAKAYAQEAGGSSSAAAPQAAQDPAPHDQPAAPADATLAEAAQGPAAAEADPAIAPATPPPGASPTDAAKTDPETGKPKAAPAPATSKPSGPDAILEEARQLAARAKAILKAAIARAKQQQHADPMELADDEKKMSDAEKAVRDAEKAMGSDAGPTAYAANGQAVAEPAATPAPSVSVQA